MFSMMESEYMIPSSPMTTHLKILLEEQRDILSTLGLSPVIGPLELSSLYGVPDDDLNRMLPTVHIANEDGHEQMLPMLDLGMIDDVIGPAEGDDSLMETASNQWMHTALATNFNTAPTVPVQNTLAMISGIVPNPMSINQGSRREDPLLPSPASSTGNIVGVPLNSPETRNVTKEEGMTQAPNCLELPSGKELLIRLRYRSQEVAREHVKNPNGCLVYYNQPQQLNRGDAAPAGVEFPGIAVNQKKKMTDTQFKYTIQILKALGNGLYLRCDETGNVYATRHCQSKVFWWSTEKGPIADGKMSDFVPQKLERNNEVKVFDIEMFQTRLRHFLVHKPTFRSEPAGLLPNNHISPISPAVYFTFAQPWNPNEGALSYCLVSMIVNPVLARKQHQWGNDDQNTSYNVSDYRLQISKSLPSIQANTNSDHHMNGMRNGSS